MADAALPVAPHIWRIPTTEFDFINSYLLIGADGQVTLVDTGLKGAPKRILAALAQLGTAPSQVTTILLTHGHADHAGGARQLAAVTGRGMTLHGADAQYVRTGTGLPLDPSTRLGRLFKTSQHADPAPVDRELLDGEVLDVVPGGLQVVHTPGHSPGHVSFLVPGSGTLITGDAIWNVRVLLEHRPADQHGPSARGAGVPHRSVHPRAAHRRRRPDRGAALPGQPPAVPHSPALTLRRRPQDPATSARRPAHGGDRWPTDDPRRS
jgi:glyoxylase-like metal-dependent hydrolase (beta-lactamase superfamily II)